MTEIKAPDGGRPVSEMQERIAEALWQAESIRCLGKPRLSIWAEESADTHEKWRFMALAAMKAMREPTDEMMDAAEWAAEEGALLDFDEDDFRLTFTAAIDAEISIAEGGKDD